MRKEQFDLALLRQEDRCMPRNQWLDLVGTAGLFVEELSPAMQAHFQRLEAVLNANCLNAVTAYELTWLIVFD